MVNNVPMQGDIIKIIMIRNESPFGNKVIEAAVNVVLDVLPQITEQG